METANFEEHRHRRFGKLNVVVKPLPVSSQEDLRINHGKVISPCNLPTVALQFQLHKLEDYWYLTPHDHPPQLLHIPEYHTNETKSLHLKLDPFEYLSDDVFSRILQGNLMSWAANCRLAKLDIEVQYMIRLIRKIVHKELNKGSPRQSLEMFVGVTFKAESVLDGRLLSEEEELSLFNNGMVPASKSSIMQLPRIEIGEEECLNDDCVICFEHLGKEGKSILCMPCSHMFHGDCITKWLEKSHLCPICRYELPTAEHGS